MVAIALVATAVGVLGIGRSEETAAPATTTTTVPFDESEEAFGEEPVADAAEIILPSVVHIQTSRGVGSGVIISEDGLIITAAHVLDGEEEVTVRFDDGEQVMGTVLGTSPPEVDIGVVQVDRTGLTPATFASEKPRVGQLAVAVGSPWNLEATVTSGIVSAVDRASCAFSGCVATVQTDAAINPGNSGGALVDRQGDVIGINVSIFTRTGGNDGVGFAIPSDIALRYAESIVSGEPLETAFLGVMGGPAAGSQAGALITEVVPGSAADEAGIQVDDVIISLDGVAVRSQQDLGAQVRAHQPGDTVEVMVLRGDEEQVRLQVTLGARDQETS